MEFTVIGHFISVVHYISDDKVGFIYIGAHWYDWSSREEMRQIANVSTWLVWPRYVDGSTKGFLMGSQRWERKKKLQINICPVLGTQACSSHLYLDSERLWHCLVFGWLPDILHICHFFTQPEVLVGTWETWIWDMNEPCNNNEWQPCKHVNERIQEHPFLYSSSCLLDNLLKCKGEFGNVVWDRMEIARQHHEIWNANVEWNIKIIYCNARVFILDDGGQGKESRICCMSHHDLLK